MNSPGKGAETFDQLKAVLCDAGISDAVAFRREATVFECEGVMGDPLIAADMVEEADNYF
jgi:hypothetical protein